MILTSKILINPNQITKDILWSISYLSKDLWNYALEQRKNKNSFGKVNVYTQKKELPEFKKAFPEYKLPSSQVIQNVLFDLEAAYKMFFTKQSRGDKEARTPKFKSYKHFVRQKYSQRKVSFEIKNNVLLLAYGSKRKEWLQITLPDSDYSTVKTVDVLYDKNSKNWYACMSYFKQEAELRTSGTVIYFDPGCKTTLTGITSTGAFIEYDINPLREVNKSTYKFLDDLISQRDKKKKGSYHFRRLSAKIKRIFDKMKTRTTTYLQTLSKKMIKDNPEVKEFKIGDWKKKETLAKTENKYVNRIINRAVQNNNPLGNLIKYLTYKAKLLGQVVSKFDERGSTRTCVQCDYVKRGGLSPSVRVFECSGCGFKYSRDHHSCLNFVKEYEEALWQRLSGNLPDRSVRMSLNPFSFKTRYRSYDIASQLRDAPHFSEGSMSQTLGILRYA